MIDGACRLIDGIPGEDTPDETPGIAFGAGTESFDLLAGSLAFVDFAISNLPVRVSPSFANPRTRQWKLRKYTADSAFAPKKPAGTAHRQVRSTRSPSSRRPD